MSSIEITPELLRAVAEAAEVTKYLTPGGVAALNSWARILERDQIAERRVEELARVSYEAESEAARGLVRGTQVEGWDNASEHQKAVTRAGIRAVLAHLEEEEVEQW